MAGSDRGRALGLGADDGHGHPEAGARQGGGGRGGEGGSGDGGSGGAPENDKLQSIWLVGQALRHQPVAFRCAEHRLDGQVSSVAV